MAALAADIKSAVRECDFALGAPNSILPQAHKAGWRRLLLFRPPYSSISSKLTRMRTEMAIGSLDTYIDFDEA
jgi:hypothetical protein